MKKKTLAFVITIVLTAGVPAVIKAQQAAFKAAFLYHFTEYINWGQAPMKAFNFAVLEQSPITTQMQIIANEKKIKNKTIQVKEYSTLETLITCHILFIPESSSVPIETIVSKFAGQPVLIVTEKEGYGKKGAHINFLVSNNKLRFEINMKAFNSSGITISSQLLQHAIIIE